MNKNILNWTMSCLRTGGRLDFAFTEALSFASYLTQVKF